MPMRTFGLLAAALAISGSAGAAMVNAPGGPAQSGSVPADAGNATNPYVNFGEAVFDVQAAPAPNAVPEPGSLALAGLALAAALAASRRRGLQTGE